MRKTIREKMKHQKSLLIFGTFSLLLLLSVGYAAFSTTIRLNAKGNVHPPVIYTVDDLIDNAGTSCDGELVEDTSEPGRYIYRGNNPCNYINVKENGTNVKYRIYSIESDGTVKVIRDESVTNMEYDVSDETRRIGGYCSQSSCNAWAAMNGFNNAGRIGDVVGLNGNSGDSSIKEYIEGTYANTLDDYSRVVLKTWNIGGTYFNNDNLLNTIADENMSTWNGKIAMITASEYIRANSNVSSCGTLKLFRNNNSMCLSTNYLINSTSWLLTPSGGGDSSGLTLFSNGLVRYDLTYVERGVRPSFYLCSGLTYKGDGTSTKPYEVAGGSCIIQNEP